MSDKHITEASNLLRHQFTDIKVYSHHAMVRTFPFNLQDHCLCRFCMFNVIIGYLIYAVHYGLIFIYDSMASVISYTVQMQAAAILQPSRSDIVFKTQRMIPQEGVSDCGLFTIAYATDLCIGNNPASYTYRCNTN